MLQDWLSLFYTPHIGAKRFQMLLSHFGSVSDAKNASDQEWKQCGMPQQVLINRHTNLEQKVESALAWISEENHKYIITFADDRYPELLKIIPDPPPLLFLHGNPALLNKPQLAIVGSRNPTDEGKENSYYFAKELASIGFTITSGLALGIDERAHRGALDQGGSTIGVLGTGLEKIYPKQHKLLSEMIVEKNGSLISEFPLHMPPIADNFPRRNRIIAGLALGTLIVEAAKKSGSLITARLSNEFNREVFAIPSSIHNPQSKGCHYLIKNGATLVESTQDIRDELKGWIPQGQSINESLKTGKKEEKIKEVLIPKEPELLKIYNVLHRSKSVDQLVEELNISAAELNNCLIILEIEGYIKNIGSSRYQRY